MSDHTLVLNKNWTAITVTSAFGALVSMCRERSHAMCPETYEIYDIHKWIDKSIGTHDHNNPQKYIQTVNYGIEKPEIIIMKEYGGVPFQQVNFTRRNLYKRDQYLCQYCSRAFITSDLTIDHVIPTSRGGPHTWENCVTACKSCNTFKANKTPQECNMELIKQPRMPKWTPIAGMLPNKRPPSWNKFLKI